MSQTLSSFCGIFVLSYPLLKFHRCQIPYQVVGEGSLRALPLSSTTAFSYNCACLNFTALKYIHLVHVFPGLLSLELYSSGPDWLWLSLPYGLSFVFGLILYFQLAVLFQGLSFIWTWMLLIFTFPHLTFWLGPLEIFVLPEFLALVSLPLSPFFLPIWFFFPAFAYLFVHSGLLSQPSM